MSRIKYLAGQQLADYLQTVLDDVPVFAQQQSADIDAIYPSVVVLPGNHQFIPTIAADVNISDLTAMLVRTGFMEGTTQVRVYATNPADRELLEQRVSEAFFAQSILRPGVVVLSIPPFNYGGINWPDESSVAFELNDAEWREEMVFTDKRYSYIDLNSQFQVFNSFRIPTMTEIEIIVKDIVSNEIIEEIILT